jgi:hypothetical protein
MGIIHAKFYPAVECRIRPIAGALHQTMLYRVIMDVIKMPLVIPFIAQRMFRVIALPDAPPTVGDKGCGAGFFRTAQGEPGLGEVLFDRAPALWIIGIARRQRPNGVHMIVQHHHRLHPERRPALEAILKSRPQQIPREVVAQNPRPSLSDHGEKVRASRNVTSPVIRHNSPVGCAPRTIFKCEMTWLL